MNKFFLITSFLLILAVVWLTNLETKTETQKPPVQYSGSGFQLEIPKINISAPIIANVNGNNQAAYFSALQNGVAHYNGTAKPGEGSNVFIFGHSSFFEADPGKFKEIFKELNLLEKNDEIIAWNNNKKYKYKVTEKKIIEPNETQYLLPTSSEQLTLMTCYPIGSTAQRLIVIAKP